MTASSAAQTIGVILAGGRSSRMGGGDKSLLAIGGRTILSRVIDCAAPQVAHLAINANGDASRFVAFGLPVLADTVPGQPGPLAGILAGLDHAVQFEGAAAVLSVAADTPFLPLDLAARLSSAADGKIAMAECGGRVHPVFALWPLSLRGALRAHLAAGGDRSVRSFAEIKGCVAVTFPAMLVGDRLADPFFNVNTPADLAEAETIAADMDP